MAGYVEDAYLCIDKMKEGPGDYFERWQSIRKIWAERLDAGPTSQDEDYTPHNHKNHNVGIYKILSDILIPESAYGKEINSENLFVLNLAVLFHDLMMAYDPSLRSEHGLAAKAYILQEFTREDFNIKPFEFESIADVIVGHTDIKDSTGKTLTNTVDSLPEKEDDFPNGKFGKIKIPLLASLLRLADELDVHSDRIHAFSSQKRKIKESSKPHWRKCEILMYPQKKQLDVTVIQLVPYERVMLADGNTDNDIQLVIEVRNKVYKELKQLNDKVFNKGYLGGWQFTNIEIKATGEILERINKLGSEVNPFSSESEPLVTIMQEPTACSTLEIKKIEETSPVIDMAPEETQVKIREWVLQKGLLLTGHFKLDEEFRVRDWIDSQVLLEDGKCLDFICDAFVERIWNIEGKVFIVGIDHHGLLLASLIGVKTNNPFSYVVSGRLSESHIAKEKEIALPSDHKIIVVTDAVITLKTVESSISYLKQSSNVTDGQIAGIYTIFLRDPVSPHAAGRLGAIDKHPLRGKIFALERSFVVERCNKTECLFLKSGIDMYSNIPQPI